MNDMTKFNYSLLPTDFQQEDIEYLEHCATDIEVGGRIAIEGIMRIGKRLNDARAKFGENDKSFGQWRKGRLPWLESQTALNFMRVHSKFGDENLLYNNYRVENLAPSILYALSAPSTPDAVIDKAVAKAESGDKVTVADVKDWKAIEAELEAEKRRNAEWSAQSTSQRQHIEALERRIDLFDSQPKPKPVIKVVEKIPADYEALKAKAAQLETELATNKAEQTRIIQSAIKAKLSGYQGEVDALEAKKRNLEQQAKEYQDYLASLTGKVKQMESQARAFEKTRQALVDLASELRDFAPIDPDLTRKALALAEMTHDATNTLRLVFEPARPELTLIQGTAA